MAETRTLMRVARAIAAAEARPVPEGMDRHVWLARTAVAALSAPYPEVDVAIGLDHPWDWRIAMRLGYERGLGSVLHGEVVDDAPPACGEAP